MLRCYKDQIFIFTIFVILRCIEKHCILTSRICNEEDTWYVTRKRIQKNKGYKVFKVIISGGQMIVKSGYMGYDDSYIIDTIYDTMYNIGGIQNVQMG